MRIDVLFLRVATIYLVLGVLCGIYMGVSGDKVLMSMHSHAGLLGWVSLAIFGFFYRFYQEVGKQMLSKIHFWLVMVSYPLMFISLAILLYGNEWAKPLLGISSIAIVMAGVLFAVIVFKATSDKRA